VEVEKKYYADGEDAYSMKKELGEMMRVRDQERERRMAIHKAQRMKEGTATKINEIEQKVKDLSVS
jgi:hypothetical protein